MPHSELSSSVPGQTSGPAAPATGASVAERPPALTRVALSRLRAERILSADAWREAMYFCGFIPNGEEWRAYWRHILLLGGALFLAAGVIFFIAWNWADMHRFGRMVLVGGLVAATGVGSVWRGPDSPSGRVLLLCCGITVGPMLAVFGQAYQTGAELWELFRIWTAILFALALAGKQSALWFVTWLSANVFVMLWLGRAMSEPLEALGIFSLLPECVLALAAAVVVWEIAAGRHRAGKSRAAGEDVSHGWLGSRWLPRLLFFDLTVRLTVYLCLWTVAPGEIRYLDVFFLPHAVLLPLAAALAGWSFYWHSKRMPDLFMPACLVAAGCALVVAALLEAEFFFDAGVGVFFIWGLVIVGLTAGAGKLLLVLQRKMEGSAQKAGQHSFRNPVTAFFAPSRPVPSWDALRARLRGAGLLATDAALPGLPLRPAFPSSPWYVRGMLALGGWIAALLFLVFLALAVFVSMNYRLSESSMLFFVSWVPLGVACVCLRAPGDFIRHFGFSQALAGTTAACVGLASMLDFWMLFPFLCAALVIGLCMIMNSAAYRLLAALAVTPLVAVGGLVQVVGGFDPRWSCANNWPLLYWTSGFVAALWWGGVAIGLATVRVCEKDLLPRRAWPVLEPAFFGAYGGMMLYLVAVLSDRVGVRDIYYVIPKAVFFSSNAFAVGLGAAAGLLFLAWHLVRGKGTAADRRGVVACAALALPLGFFLPGVGLAAFGLTLSRYCGSLVMQGVTASFLFVYMVYYYYFLGMTLWHKSLLLIGTGTALLCLAFILARSSGSRRGGSSRA